MSKEKTDHEKQLDFLLGLLMQIDHDNIIDMMDLNMGTLYNVVQNESVKTYFTNHVNDDNRLQLFKPYKEVCGLMAGTITSMNPGYAYPRSLASTITEMSRQQVYYMEHLPSLTDYTENRSDKTMAARFLKSIWVSALKKTTFAEN